MRTLRVALAVVVLLFVHGVAAAQNLRVLVTNDDGIGAPGIDSLVQELIQNPNLDVFVIAPATNQSGTTDNFTNGPLGVAAGSTASGYLGKAVSGFPADTVLYGVLQELDPDPDLVVSGINAGQNIGRFTAEDLSGTVGAAVTAGRLRIPSIAVSAGIGTTDYGPAARYTANVVEDFRTKSRLSKKMTSRAGLDQRVTLNINFPYCSSGSIRGVAVVPLAPSQDLGGRVVTGYNMTGASTFTPIFSTTNAFVTNCNSTLEKPTTDIEAMNNGFASVTALNADLTSDNKLRRFRFLSKIPF